MPETAAPVAAAPPQHPGLGALLVPYRGIIGVLVALTVAGNTLNLLIPRLVANAIDSYGRHALVVAVVAPELLLAAIGIFVFAYLQGVVQTYASERVARDLRTRLIAKVAAQDHAYIQHITPSALLTHLTSDVDAVKMFVSQAMASLISSVFLIIGASVLLIAIDWPLALAVLAVLPLVAITFSLVLRRVRTLFKRGQEAIDRLNRVINESIMGAALIRLVNSQQVEYDKFLAANTEARDISLSILRLFASLIPVIVFATNLATLIILTLGGHFVINGRMTLGDFTAFNSYLVILIFPVVMIGFMSTMMAQATASYGRIAGILHATEPTRSGTITTPLRGDISLNHVNVVLAGRQVLKDVSLAAHAGSRTAVIGPTAAGKTQLLYLLTGLIEAESGRVEYDGHAIADYDQDALHRQVGFVFQDSIVFNMTIRENIAFSPSVTDGDLEQAVATAELHDFVRVLPAGLDTMVSERGSSLSGGQKQRIMLARALALNPRVLLLDDFTARVDTATARTILENVHRNYPGITLLSVTQQIAPIADYDQIVLLMEGEVLAIGTHDELLQTSPEYAQIYDSQRSTSQYEFVALASAPAGTQPPGILASLGRLLPLMATERKRVTTACIAVVVSSLAGLVGPLIIAHTIDTYISNGRFDGVLRFAALLLLLYAAAFVATYVQTQAMGGVGRRVLFALRNTLFTKLQSLPLDFFNQNKAGDLISRINNDTDKLNQFFAQSLVQLAANLFVMIGAAIFLISLNAWLGLAALAPGIAIFFVTRLTGPWVRSRNVKSLQSLGALSSEIQESLANFKVIVAFNRRDYFKKRFDEANARTFAASVSSGIASNVFLPIFGLAYNVAQAVVLLYGIHLIAAGSITVGLLIGFLMYVNSFYLPLRQLATVWASFQLALAGLDRISDVLALESNMPVMPAEQAASHALLEFDHVGFAYPGSTGDNEVLHDVSFALQPQRTYALVGPTGGGKTTTAALMARLYDPTRGRVLLNGRDIRTYTPQERADQIGFILQEPFLVSGTIRENILYGNQKYASYTGTDLMQLLAEHNLSDLVARFDRGLDTPVTSAGEAISLGQKQLIAFMRAVLRDPKILILDEATANVDTVTEQLLEQILAKLPAWTTKVIIAHRLNTIADADEIFFINAGTITPAGSMEHALDLLLHGKRES